MAAVKGFKYDIFISYAHYDNQPPQKWVDQFHEDLENWLKYRRGFSELNIWRDRKLDGATDFNISIQNKIESSALFLALNSRNYRVSEYCQKELNWFYVHSRDRHGGLMVGERRCIFNILLNNIPHKEWPDALGKASGFHMHDANPDDEDLGEFISPRDALYEVRLRHIVDAVENILNEFSTGDEFPAPEVEDTKEIKIFIADVAESLQDYRDRIINDVQRKKAVVLDRIPPPLESRKHAESVRRAFSEADFSIHLFDQHPGRKVLDNKDTTYPREQIELALKTPSRKFIWTPQNLDPESIENQAHRLVLYNLANGERQPAEQYEFINATKTDFSNRILQYIQEQRSLSSESPEVLTFLIDTHQKDQCYAFELAHYLTKNGADVNFNKESQNPVLSLTQFEQSVRHVRNLILISGKVRSQWLLGRIKKTVKTIAEHLETGENLLLEKIWIYKTPDGENDIDLSGFPPIIIKLIKVLDNSEFPCIDHGVISPLLQASC